MLAVAALWGIREHSVLLAASPDVREAETPERLERVKALPGVRGVYVIKGTLTEIEGGLVVCGIEL